MSDQSDSAALEAAAAQVDADLTADDNTITGLQQQLATSQAALAAETAKDQTDEATITSLQAEVAALQAQLAGSAVPGPPTSLVATAGDTSVVLTWGAPVTGGAPTDYSVTTTPGGVITDVRTALTATVSGLTNGTAYTFAVTPSNAAGSGPYAAATVTPSAPVNPPIVVVGTLPFAAKGSAIWYTPLSSSAPLHANSAAYVKKLTTQPWPYGNPNVNAFTWCPSVYFTDGTDPKVTVTDSNSGQQRTWSMTIPAGAMPEAESDEELIVVNTVTGDIWEMWEFKWTAKGSAASAASVAHGNSNTGNGTFARISGAGGTCAASGLSYAAGLITPEEVLAGSINHAMLFGCPYTSGGFIAPALSADGNTSGGIPEGAHFRLPASYVLPSGLSTFETCFATALKTYGMYLNDTAGSVAVYCQNDLSKTSIGKPSLWTQVFGSTPGYQALNGLSGMWSQLQVLAPPTS